MPSPVLHTALLHTHNILRWVVLIAAIVAVVRAWRSGATGRAGLVLTIALDTQVLLGIVMYAVTSPIVRAALANMSGTMKDRVLRFWAVEHPFSMIVALVLVHVARVLERRGKKRAVAILLTIALVALLAGIPWPFMPYGRPLFPGM
jgi:hypothetical protein